MAQRAQRQCTSYYCGHSVKVQPVGKQTTSTGHRQFKVLGRVPAKEKHPSEVASYYTSCACGSSTS
eukprot:11831535-Karenia_brevis.AAC.1